MGQPAAKQGDQITATDTHVVVPSSGTPSPAPFPFAGRITGGLSENVFICGLSAATVGSAATNEPHHIPPAGCSFQKTPGNQGKIIKGSGTVFISGRSAARNGDTAQTCNDPVDLPVGQVVSTTATVFVG